MPADLPHIPVVFSRWDSNSITGWFAAHGRRSAVVTAAGSDGVGSPPDPHVERLIKRKLDKKGVRLSFLIFAHHNGYPVWVAVGDRGK